MKYFNDKVKVLLHGGDYNPEQWIDYPQVLQEDMRLMKKAEINSATVGIFSWAMLEPEEGRFDFSFLDDTFERLTKINSHIILATPSGARPRWLAEKYPEVLRVDKTGHRARFGGRHNHCMTSPRYREKVQIMNRKLAERYGKHPNLVLWHISNEYSGECHCELCYQAFQDYLKQKFNGDLDRLNHEWWTTFWSHRYTSWDQIIPGDYSVHGLELEWKRYCNAQIIDFMKAELEPIRELTPNIPITTNMVEFWWSNYRKMAREVDVVSWDNYPCWHGSNQIEEASKTAFWHDFFRGVKDGQPFLMMESTPSKVNWKPYNKLKRPGMHRLSALQAIAHGSDSVQYFQWRQSRGSSEKFHGAVVSHRGTEETREYQDVASVGETLRKVSEIAGTEVESQVAILMDVESMWALEEAQGFQLENKKYFETLLQVHQSFWKQGINVDIIFPDSDFSKYKLIAAPMLYMTSKNTIEKISDYVTSGGTLVSGYMTGLVNENDLCWLGGFPGEELKHVFGLWTEETDSLYPEDRNVIRYGEKEYEAIDYCEVVHPKTAEVLGVYGSDYYKDMPAVCKNSFGKGTAYYIAFRDNGTFTDEFYSCLCDRIQIKKNAISLSEGTTVHVRKGLEREYFFLENYKENPGTIVLDGCYRDLETGEEVSGEVKLPPFGSKILWR